MRETLQKNGFWLGVLLLCLSYIGFQFFYTYYAPLSVDEFWFSHWTHRYLKSMPYRDFSPYKTTLGYYFLLLPLSLSTHFLTPLLYTKNCLALLNASLFFVSAYWLKKFFPKPAVLACLSLLITTEFVLSHSTNIRVDFLAYWFCLFSVLCLLNRNYLLAGIILGLGFATSQKALWYIVASDAALGISWLVFERNWKNFREVVVFNIAFLMTVALYIAFWAALSSVHAVLQSMFYEAAVIYKFNLYESARRIFWTYTLTYNPLLFLVWPLTLISLVVRTQDAAFNKRQLFCHLYAATIMLCLILYKQIFPYYMLTTIPAFMLSYSAFFAWSLRVIKQDSSLTILWIGTTGLWILLFSYFSGIIWAYEFFELASSYVLIAIIPLLLGIVITKRPLFSQGVQLVLPQLMGLTLLFTGIIYPLLNFGSMALPNRSGAYQRYTLNFAQRLLQDHSDYVAGIDVFYDRNQPIAGMQHLDAAALTYLYDPSPELLPIMMPSLYHSPATQHDIITALNHSHVKFYINNYQMNSLPPALKSYLAAEYLHYSGSIYLYAPTISAGRQQTFIRFKGNYKLISHVTIFTNGKKIHPNEWVKLNVGNFTASSAAPYRLQLIPERMDYFLDPVFKDDQWERMFG